MKINLLSLLLIILISSQCRKEKGCAPIPDLPQDFLSYWFFPEESYWVYQLKDSVLLDTMTVTKTSIQIEDMGAEGSDCIKSYRMFLKHSAYIYNDTNYTFFESYYGEDQSKFWINIGSNLFSDFSSNSSDVFYPFVVGDTIENFNFRIILLDTLPVTTIYGTFNNVIHVLYEKRNCCIGSEIWLAKNTGLVRFFTKNREEWELTDYQLKEL